MHAKSNFFGPNERRRAMVIAACAAGGWILDSWTVPYLSELEPSLRPAPVFFAGLAYGPAAGAFTAAVAASQELLAGEPALWLVAVAQGALVAALPRRRMPSLVAVALVWLVAELPLALARASSPSLAALEAAGTLITGILAVALAELALAQGWIRHLAAPLPPYAGRRPLRAILVNVFVVLGALPPLFIAGSSGRAEIEGRRRDAIHQLESRARALAAQLDESVDHRQRGLAGAARLGFPAGGLPEPAELALRLGQIRELYPGFLTLLAADAEGRLIATDPPRDPQGVSLVERGVTVADRPYFQAPMRTGEAFVSGVFTGRGFGTDPIVAISVPIPGPLGRPAGILEGSVQLDWLRELVEAPAGEDRVLILDRDFKAIVSGPTALTPAAAELAGSQLADRAREGDGSFELAGAAGLPLLDRPCLIAQSVAPHTGWRILVARPLAAIRSGAELQFLRSVAWAMLIIAATIGVVSRIAWHVTKPLARLAAAQTTLAASRTLPELDQPSYSGPAEIARLVSSFRQVSAVLVEAYATLRRTIGEREHLNAQLEKLLAEREQKVFERTAQLASATAVAERHARAKSDFLAHMSHEIRTPLNAVVGISDALLASRLTPVQREHAGALRASAEALLAVVNDTLDLAKLEAGSLEIDRRPTDLRELVDDSILLFAARAFDKGLELIADVAPEIPAQVVVDAPRLRQILLNLIANALRFTEKGSVAVEVDPAPGGIQVAIRDTGIGIAEQLQNRLFKPYDQLGVNPGQACGGTGLGLAISSSLVAAMGGSIDCESQVGVGTTFRFTLPAPRAGGDRAPPPVSGRRLLVAAVSAGTRRALVRQLEGWGAQVVARRALDAEVRPGAGHSFDGALIEAAAAGAQRFAEGWKAAGNPRALGIFVPLGRALDESWQNLPGTRLGKPLRSSLLAAFLRQAFAAPPAEPGERSVVLAPNPVGRRALEGRARRAGFAVAAAGDVAAALQLLAAEPARLVLVDLAGERAGAGELAKRLREAAAETLGRPLLVWIGDRPGDAPEGFDRSLGRPPDLEALAALRQELEEREEPE